MTTNTREHWYAARTENAHDQGLVISEDTGEIIAVTYKTGACLLVSSLQTDRRYREHS